MPGPSTDELVRRYRAGESCAAIAAATGLRPTTVQGRLKRAGAKLRPPGRPASRGPLGVTDADLVARYRAGESCAAIGEATGLSRTTVHGRLRRAGVELRRGAEARRHERLDLPVAGILERYRAGESAEAIGRSLGIAGQTVRRRLAEAGIERRRTRRGRAPRPREPRAVTIRVGVKRRAVEEFLRRPEAGEMTQQEIADVCNVDQSYVSAIAKRLRATDHGA
jgi:DNA-binding CsgD family transcriptional regulator